MCYAIPGKVESINDNIAVIDYFGEKRNVLIDTDIKIGDYVYAQGGIIVDKVPEEHAEEVLAFWKEKFFELKQKDEELSQVNTENAEKNLLELLQKVNLDQELTKNELLSLINIKNSEELDLLYQFSNNVRQKEHDNACCVHGIIEFSNNCDKNCLYCGIRNTKNMQRYRIPDEKIIELAEDAVKNLGFKAFVLQSGEDSHYNEQKLIELVQKIRKLGVLVFISIGFRSIETYKRLFQAGAKAVLLRFETSNKKIFENICPNTDFEARINLIRQLKEIGYIVATGFMIGLPDETDEDIINNILLTKELKADMYSFGPFIPTKGTPLEEHPTTTKEKILKTIALTRFIDKQSKILVTTASETLDPKAKKEGLMAGANSLMLNITPDKYKQLYNIYDNKAQNESEIKKNIKDTVELLYSLGRAPTDLGI